MKYLKTLKELSEEISHNNDSPSSYRKYGNSTYRPSIIAQSPKPTGERSKGYDNDPEYRGYFKSVE